MMPSGRVCPNRSGESVPRWGLLRGSRIVVEEFVEVDWSHGGRQHRSAVPTGERATTVGGAASGEGRQTTFRSCQVVVGGGASPIVGKGLAVPYPSTSRLEVIILSESVQEASWMRASSSRTGTYDRVFWMAVLAGYISSIQARVVQHIMNASVPVREAR